MSLSYEPLWEMLDELNISKMEFAKAIGISNATLAKLSKNEPVTLTTVDKICNEFECKIENIVQHIPDLLNKKKSNLPLEKGTIILSDMPISASFKRIQADNSLKPFVILEIRENIVNNVTTWQYIAAPLTNAPTHYLSIYFENVLISDKLKNGWISLDCLQDIPSEKLIRIVGKMSNKTIKKIDKFMISVKELLDNE